MKEAYDYSMFRKNSVMISLTKPVKLKDGKLKMFINASKFSDKLGKLDWDNRITASLSHSDCAALLKGLLYKKNVDLFHKFGNSNSATTIKLNFDKGNPLLSITKNGDNIFIVINEDEYVILIELLKYAIPRLVGWEPTTQNPYA